MPYTLEQLQQNDYYQKLKDADRQEILNKFEVESQRYAISGSNAESVLIRNDNDTIISFEDPDNIGNDIQEAVGGNYIIPQSYYPRFVSDIEQIKTVIDTTIRSL